MEIKTLLNKSWYYVLFLIVAFPLFGLKLVSITIILLSILGLTLIILGGKATINKTKIKWVLILSSIYLIYIVSSLFYPMDRVSGFILERKMSLIIFPILLILVPNNIEKEHFRKLLLGFVMASIGIAIFTNVYIFIKGIPLEYSLYSDSSFAYRTFFEDISGIHPTYISIYLAFSGLILIHFGLKDKKHIIWYGIAFLICTSCMIPLAAKLPMIAFIISLGIYFIIQPSILKKVKYLFFVLIAGLLITAYSVPSLKIRVDEVVNSSFTPPHGYNTYNSINIRTGIWECSLSLIKDNWIKGVGANQLQNHLNNCYKRFDTNAYTLRDYNTHNEYFNILLGTGLVGLTAFLYLLVTLTYQAYKVKDSLFFTLLTLIMLCFTTENLLDRQGGVVFVSFFLSLFTRRFVIQSNSVKSNIV